MNRYRKLVAALIAAAAIAGNEFFGVTEGEVQQIANVVLALLGALGVERLRNEA